MGSKILLSKIPALTFYKDQKTAARRTSPIPQLKCSGKACKIYTPDAVRCTNLGGSGVDVDWKCEADLPDSLRFGKVDVSCEGWSRPGDSYVLKGSCGLEYGLIEIPSSLRNDHYAKKSSSFNPSTAVFTLGGLFLVVFIIYSFLKSCIRSAPAAGPGGGADAGRPNPSHWWTSGWGGGAGGGDGWRRHFPGAYDPPPPYKASSPTGSTNANATGWTPGFWSGAALGGIGSYLYSRNNPRQSQRYDWEDRIQQPTMFGSGLFRGASSSRVSGNSGWGGWGSSSRPTSDDRGEGSSTGPGTLRASTGYARSNVR